MPDTALRRVFGRALLHVAALFSVPALLRALELKPARRVAVFYCGIVLLGLAAAMLAGRSSRHRWTAAAARTGYLGASSLLLIVAAIHADNTLHYGALVADSADAIFQTDVFEALLYIADYTNPWSLVIAAGWVAAFVATGLYFFRAPLPQRSSAAMLGLVAAALSLGGLAAITRSDDALLLYREAIAYRTTLADYQASRSALRGRAGAGIASDFEGDLVVVIGESISRHHLQLYGYPRETTPHLLARRDELLVFTDVISTSSHSVPSLLDALSFQYRAERREFLELPDIVSVANEAGFSTLWLSNQNPVGVWDNLVAAVARGAQRTVFHSSGGGTAMERDVFDGEMLPSFDAALQEPGIRKLIFVHLMAAHGPYCRVLPAEYRSPDGAIFSLPADAALFGEYRPRRFIGRPRKERKFVERINCYDSAMRYVDVVLNDLFERLDRSPRPALLVFLADHGEAPLLGTGHEGRLHSHFHVEVPFLLWANEAYRSRDPSRWRRFAANQHAPASLVDLSFTLADLGQVRGIDGVAERSLVSERFRPFERTTLRERVGYDVWTEASDPVEKARANLRRACERAGTERCDKLWAHRVNSLGALLQARTVFSGVELDVVYDAKAERFRIYHSPADDVGLTLETYLRPDDGELAYWLDWKDPLEHELPAAIDRLEALDRRHAIRSRSIVEMSEATEATARLAALGWRTSYYMPTAAISEALAKDDPERCRRLARTILDAVERGSFTAVSYDENVRRFVDVYLRESLREAGLREYTWDLSLPVHDEDISGLERHLADPVVDVVLVPFESPFDL